LIEQQEVCFPLIFYPFKKSNIGYIYGLDRGLKPSLHFPASDKQDLGIIQPFLTFQVYFPAGEHFTIEITITNTTKVKSHNFSTNNPNF